MERTRDLSGAAGSRSEQRPEGTTTRADAERQAAPPEHEVEARRRAERRDTVQEASDDSFPASDPPAWIDVWL